MKSIKVNVTNVFVLGLLLLASPVLGKLNGPVANNKDFWSAVAMGTAGGRSLQVSDYGIPDDVENGVSEGDPLEGGGLEGGNHGSNLEQCEGDVS